jgi:hypothetical protein
MHHDEDNVLYSGLDRKEIERECASDSDNESGDTDITTDTDTNDDDELEEFSLWTMSSRSPRSVY